MWKKIIVSVFNKLNIDRIDNMLFLLICVEK